jgi:desulfoferrodoxin (superoxide reductase-like protein)
MPQTINKTFYVCDKCGFEHAQLQDAIQCENLPLLEEQNNLAQLNVGDDIEYNNEEQSFTRWIYTGKAGKIASKKLVVSTNNQTGQKNHQYVYRVEDDLGFIDGVVWANDDFGWRLFSPAELKWRKSQ